MTISAGDWTVFFTRPLSASILAIAAFAILAPKVYELVASRRSGALIVKS
jgi:putative tricarboxylic transport membrane protein